jgi:hypothetical protein
MALQYESHNHESPFGLYGPLHEKLNFYRSKLDTWVEHQKELADKVAAEQKEAIAKKQAEVDHQVTSILALNIDENLYVDGKENVHDVQGRVENEQQRVETLQKQLDGKKQELEGTSYMQIKSNFFSSPFLFSSLLQSCEKSITSSKSERSKFGDKNRRRKCPKKQRSTISPGELSTTNILVWTLSGSQMISYGKSLSESLSVF